jgi:hypothetical protein
MPQIRYVFTNALLVRNRRNIQRKRYRTPGIIIIVTIAPRALPIRIGTSTPAATPEIISFSAISSADNDIITRVGMKSGLLTED